MLRDGACSQAATATRLTTSAYPDPLKMPLNRMGVVELALLNRESRFKSKEAGGIY
jgi:hypothetical protein